jgi:hypothetical protein
MEKTFYIIIAENDNETQTESFKTARKAFREGFTVLEVKTMKIYAGLSKIEIKISTEMTSM